MKRLIAISIMAIVLLSSANLVCAEVFFIPKASITIDGDISDWSSIQPAFVDKVNDQNSTSDFDGTDIQEFYLAKDGTFLYLMMKLYDGNPKTDAETLYIFEANKHSTEKDTTGQRFVAASLSFGQRGVFVAEIGMELILPIL